MDTLIQLSVENVNITVCDAFLRSILTSFICKKHYNSLHIIKQMMEYVVENTFNIAKAFRL